MYLIGKRVVLRSVEHEDLDMLRELSNSPDFEKMITGYSFPISKKDQEEWFANYKASDKALRFIIETQEDGAVGMTGLQNINWKDGVADAGGMRVARRNLRCKGIATDAYMTLFKYAFDELRLNRINGSAIEYNEISLHVTQKVGFKKEGVMRQAIYKNGKFNDVVMLGILKEDYLEKAKELGYLDEE